MKPLPLRILALIFLLLALTACSIQPRTVTFDKVTYNYQTSQGNTDTYTAPNGQTLVIAPSLEETKVIVNGQIYLLTGTEGDFNVLLPDGRKLSKHYEANSSAGSTNFGTTVTIEEWDQVDQLHEILFHSAQAQKNAENSRRYLVGAILFGVGLLQAINPRLVWKVSEGWRYANVQPSDLFLGLSRLAGVVLMLVALYVAFLG